MKRSLFFICLNLLILVFNSFSQNEILMTIGDKEISKAEFLRIYEKNNTPDVSLEVKSAEEYLDLFINFKLKVIEAESLGMDTMKIFTDELDMYRTELVKPYLIDNDKYEALINEAYERMKQEVKISYIYFEVPVKTLAKDTLAIYNKALNVYKKLSKGGDFDKITSDSTFEITSSGDAWYLTSLRAPYQIENFMYNNETGAVSLPLREKNGYYIIKVTDKRANKGEVKVAHIMVAVPQNSTQEVQASAEEKIKMIKEKIKNGEDFATLAKEYSDDKSSGVNGGELEFFGTGIMVQPFEEAAFALKNVGDISEPVKTFFGWHIIKKLDEKVLGTYDELYTDLKTKVKNDVRYDLCEKSVIEKIKKETNFKTENGISNFYKIVDSTIYKAKWDVTKAKNLNAVLFTFADKKITEQDFANYLYDNQKWKLETDINIFLDEEYETFTNETILEYEKNNLENKYEDFKLIMQEYHDGILLFSLQQEKVWDKAINDTIGLEKFYNDIKNNYIANEKMDASIFSYTDKLDLKKAQKIINKNIKKGIADSSLVLLVDKNSENFKFESSDIYEKGTNTTIDKAFENIQTSDNKNVIVLCDLKNIIVIHKIIPSQPKELKEIKGIVISEYQTKLEEEWIKELRSKYEIKVDENILKTIK